MADYTRIQLLADDRIAEWWAETKDQRDRQDMIRQAINIGLDVLQGKVGVFDPGKVETYKAIETLLRNGVIPTAPGEQGPAAAAPKVEPKKIGRTQRK